MGTLAPCTAWRCALYLVVISLAGLASAHARADHATDQIPGYDISWPQCEKAYPSGPIAFAIIGINHGRPYTANPCFQDQYRWAQQFEPNPAVYVNTEFPKPGREEANTGPYGTCAAADDWCRAYNYGYGTGREVTQRAASLGIAPKMWWLDVETGNYWLDTEYAHYNAQVIRGVVEFFLERHLPVGIYGTPRQWGLVAGSYAPGLPVWTAGAQGIAGAALRCSDPAYAFGGGTVAMVQYYDFGFDTNYECPHGHPVSGAGRDLPHRRVVPMVTR